MERDPSARTRTQSATSPRSKSKRQDCVAPRELSFAGRRSAVFPRVPKNKRQQHRIAWTALMPKSVSQPLRPGKITEKELSKADKPHESRVASKCRLSPRRFRLPSGKRFYGCAVWT